MTKREIVHLTEEERMWCKAHFNFVLTMGGRYRKIKVPKKRGSRADEPSEPTRH